MTPPDLAVCAGSAIPELTVEMVVAFTSGVTTVAGFQTVVLQLSTSLLAGLAVTAVAWLALLVVVAHGRYVTDAVAAGKYRKGPFRSRNREQDAEDGDETE